MQPHTNRVILQHYSFQHLFNVCWLLDKAPSLWKREMLKLSTTFLTVCTIEYRLYPRQNRFRVDQETYRRKVVTINRKIKRFTRSIDTKIIDLGRRCYTLQRVGDGVHFTVGGQNSLCRTLNNVISAYIHRSSS